MAATPDELVAPPQEIPGVYADAVAKLHKTARNLMVLKGIPWFIQATLSDEGFVSMEDLATRWDSPDRARETAPGELGFAPNNHHYTDVTSRLVAARMFQVVHAAQRSMGVGAHATPRISRSRANGDSWRGFGRRRPSSPNPSWPFKEATSW